MELRNGGLMAVSIPYEDWLKKTQPKESMKEYKVIVSDNETTEWWLNGKRHREDGPAVVCANGTMSWYLNGKLHREDGPAIELANGYKSWWLDGKPYSYENWLKKVQPAPCENKVVIIDGQKYKLVAMS